MPLDTPSIQTHYEEGKDFDVSTETNEMGNIFFYFRDTQGSLIGYIKAYYEELSDGPFVLKRGIIIDTVSAYKVEQNAPEILGFLRENGYITGTGLPGFGVSMYSHVLQYFQNNYGDISVDIDAYEKNKEYVWRLIVKVKERTSGIIKNYRGGDDGNVARIYLLKNSKNEKKS